MLCRVRSRNAFRGRSVFLGSYVWSKAIDDGNSYRRQGDQGELAQDSLHASEKSAGYDVRHRVVASFLYEVPVCGPGKPCFGSAGRVLLGGWQVNGNRSRRRADFSSHRFWPAPPPRTARAHPAPIVVAGVSPYLPEKPAKRRPLAQCHGVQLCGAFHHRPRRCQRLGRTGHERGRFARF